MTPDPDFHGAKVAFFVGDKLLVYRRDDKADIPFPAMLDLPGGGREDGESGAQCCARETQEEFGIEVDPSALKFVDEDDHWSGTGAKALFFVGELTDGDIAQIRFGDEGQGWQLMPIADFLNAGDAVPHLQQKLRLHLNPAKP